MHAYSHLRNNMGKLINLFTQCDGLIEGLIILLNKTSQVSTKSVCMCARVSLCELKSVKVKVNSHLKPQLREPCHVLNEMS